MAARAGGGDGSCWRRLAAVAVARAGGGGGLRAAVLAACGRRCWRWRLASGGGSPRARSAFAGRDRSALIGLPAEGDLGSGRAQLYGARSAVPALRYTLCARSALAGGAR